MFFEIRKCQCCQMPGLAFSCTRFAYRILQVILSQIAQKFVIFELRLYIRFVKSCSFGCHLNFVERSLCFCIRSRYRCTQIFQHTRYRLGFLQFKPSKLLRIFLSGFAHGYLAGNQRKFGRTNNPLPKFFFVGCLRNLTQCANTSFNTSRL